jgi:Transposase IS116/IS110/IS902 family
LADKRLQETPEQLCDTLGASTDLNPVYRRLLRMALQELQLLEEQIGRLDRELACLLSEHQDALQRLAEVPGLGVDSAQQIIAELGPTAATFPSRKCLSSWVGACLGDDETAGVDYSHHSPKGNRHMRRLLNQATHAAARSKVACSQRFTGFSSSLSPIGPGPRDGRIRDVVPMSVSVLLPFHLCGLVRLPPDFSESSLLMFIIPSYRDMRSTG